VLDDIFKKIAVRDGGFANVVVSEDGEVMPVAGLPLGIEFWIGTIAGNVNQRSLFPESPGRDEDGNFAFVASSTHQDGWEWAASIQMVLNYYGAAATQRDIVARVSSGAVDWGSDEVKNSVLSGWQLMSTGSILTTHSEVHTGPPPAETLIDELSQQHPILLFLESGSVSGRVVVVTAASYIKTAAGLQITSLILRDPSPDSVNIANSGRLEVSSLELRQLAALVRGYWLIRVVYPLNKYTLKGNTRRVGL
jgi:hypothetical protein